jgi:hypothetical protein
MKHPFREAEQNGLKNPGAERRPKTLRFPMPVRGRESGAGREAVASENANEKTNGGVMKAEYRDAISRFSETSAPVGE